MLDTTDNRALGTMESQQTVDRVTVETIAGSNEVSVYQEHAAGGVQPPGEVTLFGMRDLRALHFLTGELIRDAENVARAHP
jgi:hypothetical protein